MKVKPIRSDEIYNKIMCASKEKKNDIYRYELMMPFEKKWDCYVEKGIGLPVQEYLFTVLLANPESPYITMNEGKPIIMYAFSLFSGKMTLPLGK